VNNAMSNRLENIEKLTQLAKKRTSATLERFGYNLTWDEYQKKYFGSRFYEWTNTKAEHLFRLVWDGRDSWLILQENWTSDIKKKKYWGDIIVQPFDSNNSSDRYINSLVDKIEEKIEKHYAQQL
jgi:hypothetical protein